MILEIPPRDPEPWPSLGGYVCEWIEENLVFGPGDLLGQPAKLDDEKRILIWRAYEVFPQGHEQAGRRRFKRVAFSLRKASAKTELLAWIVAAELAPDGPVRCAGFRKVRGEWLPVARPVRNPYIPLLAYTEEQSEELAYGALREILMRSKIADRFDIGLDRIIRLGRGGGGDGKAEAVAGSPSARDGARTTLNAIDESHRLSTPSLRRAHQTMLQNIPKRKASDAWTLEITTAYLPGEKSVAEETHRYAKAVDEGRIKDSRLFFFHRQAKDGYKLEDRGERRRAVVEAAGPVAAWSDIDEVTDQYDDPTVDRTYWERVWLNRPVRSADRAFDVERWKALARRKRQAKKGVTITLGFKGTRYHDATAIVATEVDTGFQWVVGCWEEDPLAERWQVPIDEVQDAIEAVFEDYDVWRMYADPYPWESVVNDWAGKYGKNASKLPRVAFFFTRLHRKMADAVSGFATAQAEGTLKHAEDERYDRHIGNAHRQPIQTRDAEGNQLWVIQKPRPDAPEPIDLAVAGILSWQARTDARKGGVGLEPEPPEQDYRVDWVA
ncbi:MAG: terminase [Planctomycetota bacterium]|jgi:phage terminase large subunit-like protein